MGALLSRGRHAARRAHGRERGRLRMVDDGVAKGVTKLGLRSERVGDRLVLGPFEGPGAAGCFRNSSIERATASRATSRTERSVSLCSPHPLCVCRHEAKASFKDAAAVPRRRHERPSLPKPPLPQRGVQRDDHHVHVLFAHRRRRSDVPNIHRSPAGVLGHLARRAAPRLRGDFLARGRPRPLLHSARCRFGDPAAPAAALHTRATWHGERTRSLAHGARRRDRVPADDLGHPTAAVVGEHGLRGASSLPLERRVRIGVRRRPASDAVVNTWSATRARDA